MKRYTIHILSLIVILCVVSPSSGKDVIKLGFVDNFSGMAGYTTGDRWKGAKLAVLEANETGGILGRKIELFPRDDMGTPDTSVKHMEELVHREKVSLIIGNTTSSCLLAMSRWAKDNKCLLFACDGRTDRAIVNFGHRYIFRSLTDTYMDANAMAQYLSRKPWTKYATIASDMEFGHMGIQHFESLLKKLKPEAEFVTNQWPKIGEIDYTAYITAILASKADHVYSMLWGGDAMAFINQSKTYGVFEKMTITMSHLNSGILEPMGKAMPEGIYASGNYTVMIDTPENKAFASRWQKEYGTVASDPGYVGYVGLKFVVEGIKKARSAETEKLIDALEGLTIRTPTGPNTLRKFDHQGSMAVVIGKSIKTKEYPAFLVISVEEIIPGDKIMMPISTIQEIRAKEK